LRAAYLIFEEEEGLNAAGAACGLRFCAPFCTNACMHGEVEEDGGFLVQVIAVPEQVQKIYV